MLKITEELRDNLVAYLINRPYRESVAGIDQLSKLEKIIESEEPKANEDKKKR